MHSNCYLDFVILRILRHVYAVSPCCHHSANRQESRCWTPVLSQTRPMEDHYKSAAQRVVTFHLRHNTSVPVKFARCRTTVCRSAAKPEVVNLLLNRIRSNPFYNVAPASDVPIYGTHQTRVSLTHETPLFLFRSLRQIPSFSVQISPPDPLLATRSLRQIMIFYIFWLREVVVSALRGTHTYGSVRASCACVPRGWYLRTYTAHNSTSTQFSRSVSPTPSSRCSDSTQLNFLLQGCHHQLYIDLSRLYWTDCSVLRPCRLIHCIASSLCPARRPDLQMHSAPSAPADTRHSSYFHTATPRLRKRLLTNRRASTLFVAPFPRGTLSKSRQ